MYTAENAKRSRTYNAQKYDFLIDGFELYVKSPEIRRFGPAEIGINRRSG